MIDMKLGEIGTTFLSMPPAFQEIEDQCFGYAVDRQVKKIMDKAKNVGIWSDMDSVDSKYYGYMAAMLRSPYYLSSLSDSDKLNVIKATLRSHSYAGTVKGIKELLKVVFPDAEFVPWFEYDEIGEPFHFKIVMDTSPNEELARRFADILKYVKPQRSIIDGLETKTHIFDLQAYVTTGEWHVERLEEIQ